MSKIDYMIWDFTKKCNLNCVYCYTEAKWKFDPNELTVKQIKEEVIPQFSEVSLRGLCLAGGEPLLHPNFKELIQYVRGLKKDLTLVILTNCDEESKLQILEELEEDHPFDHIISSSDLGIAKPNPDVYRTILERLEVKPKQVLYFDDSVDNVYAAEDIGIQAYVYRSLPEFIIRVKDASQITPEIILKTFRKD